VCSNRAATHPCSLLEGIARSRHKPLYSDRRVAWTACSDAEHHPSVATVAVEPRHDFSVARDEVDSVFLPGPGSATEEHEVRAAFAVGSQGG
jgi:hypothetical protein